MLIHPVFERSTRGRESRIERAGDETGRASKVVVGIDDPVIEKAERLERWQARERPLREAGFYRSGVRGDVER
jgi:hypothetical protein